MAVEEPALSRLISLLRFPLGVPRDDHGREAGVSQCCRNRCLSHPNCR